MCFEQTSNIILNGFIAVGTVSVAILAIWGDWFKQKLARPKLNIDVLDSSKRTFAIHTDKKAKYLYLKISNKSKSAIAIKTRVLVTKI